MSFRRSIRINTIKVWHETVHNKQAKEKRVHSVTEFLFFSLSVIQWHPHLVYAYGYNVNRIIEWIYVDRFILLL